VPDTDAGAGQEIGKETPNVRKLILSLACGLLALGVTTTAAAAPLNWEGTATMILGEFPPTDVPGGGVATVNGSGSLTGGDHLSQLGLAASRGQIATNFTLLVTDPESEGNGVAAIRFIDVEGGTGTLGNISGAIASTSALSPNQIPIQGLVKLCLINTTCATSLDILLATPTTVNGVPGTGLKAVGVGGLITVGGGTQTIRLSIQGAPWTVNTATLVDHVETLGGENTTFSAVTFRGFAHGPASATSSTASPSGVVQIVTPVQVVTNLQFGTNKKVGAGVIFLIHFIPEPGLLLLLGSGVVGLAVLGRKRMKK
jgi:hypothetical protein